ncbi:MAG: ABC transporter ATP-binding protein [Candidatus Kuenenia sp.]|nr:ABC transporter ATP-binding protein [Candidatus Kuenenia hertensis]
MTYCIETFNLTKKYPLIKNYRDLLLHPLQKKESTALSEVNLKIKKGELFGLLGSNGAGKTTLIKIFCTMVLPTSGTTSINGLDVIHQGKKIKKIIGYVICDERSFYWRLTGRQNLKFFARLNNVIRSDMDTKINDLLSFMDLSHEADKMFKDYSTGTRKKLAIARGLLTNPDILLMDEPTNALDPITAQKIRVFIREKLVNEMKKTVVFATHNLHEAEELCDRIAFIHKGRVKITGTVEEIKKMISTEKYYVVELENPDVSLLEKISAFPLVKEIVNISEPTEVNTIEIEINTQTGSESIFHIIKHIIDMDGKICSFYQKELSLVELFSRIIDKDSN